MDYERPETGELLPPWSAYQEEVADFFRRLGLRAETNVRLEGARGVHDVDVVVTFRSAGIDVTWVVECKQWSRPIPKERVLILAGVMDDLGADRGLIVAESGFQAGAIRASLNTSITLTSLDDLTTNTAHERTQIQLAALKSRIASLYALTMGLWRWAPPSVPSGGIDLGQMVDLAGETFELSALVLPKAVSDAYPIFVRAEGAMTAAAGPEELVAVLEPHVASLESRGLELSGIASTRAAHVHDLVSDLEAAASDLVAAGSVLPTDLRGSEAEVQLSAFLAAMQRIGAAADDLKTSAPDVVRAELGRLMRHLIGNSYLATESGVADWPAEGAAILRHIAKVRDAWRASRLSP